MTSWASQNEFINGNMHLIMEAGAELSKVLDCPVHYPANEKRMFECHCEIPFPLYMVEHAMETGDWESIEARHKEMQVQ